MAQWHQERLTHAVILLTSDQRAIVQSEGQRHCDHRGWRLWAVNARSNHVHAVVTAEGFSGKVVRDQLKANCTRGLREQCDVYRDRPVWTVGGDWQCINDEEELHNACSYVLDVQDRKDRDSAAGV